MAPARMEPQNVNSFLCSMKLGREGKVARFMCPRGKEHGRKEDREGLRNGPMSAPK